MFEEIDPIFEEENQKILIERIKTASDCRLFGASRFIEGAYVNESGITRETKWRKVAIPWDKIEYIEIKDKGSDIEYIIFRSGTISLTCTNSSSDNKLSLDIVSEYVGEIERWHLFDDLTEIAETTDSDRIYMRPDMDKSTGWTRLEYILIRECIGEVDFEIYLTEEKSSAKTDEELFELILNDPQCEYLVDSSIFARVINKWKVTVVLFGVAFAVAMLAIFFQPYHFLIYIISFFLFILSFGGLFISDEKIIISPIGIGKYQHQELQAIEWQYIEFIKLQFYEDILVFADFYGNRRRIACGDYKSKHLISMDLIRRYIVDIDEWIKTGLKSWGEGAFRLVRPDE